MRLLLAILLLCQTALAQFDDPAFVGSLDSAPAAPTGYDPSVTAAHWWKTDTLSASSDGDAIQTWPSSKGGVDFTQATLANRPLYKVSQQNGRAILLADGVNDYMSTANITTITQVYSVIIMGKSLTATNTSAALFTEVNGTAVSILARGTGQYAVNGGSGFQNSTILLNSAFHIIIVVFNGTSTKIAIDGGAFQTLPGNPGTSPLSNGSGALRFAANPVPAQFCNMWAGEIIVEARDVTADRADIFTYGNARWAAY